jgi:hypothetical protein
MSLSKRREKRARHGAARKSLNAGERSSLNWLERIAASSTTASKVSWPQCPIQSGARRRAYDGGRLGASRLQESITLESL